MPSLHTCTLIRNLNLLEFTFVIVRLGQDMEVRLDGVSYQSRVHGTYHQLDTTSTVMLGGAGNTETLVQDLSRGHFIRGFQVRTIGEINLHVK